MLFVNKEFNVPVKNKNKSINEKYVPLVNKNLLFDICYLLIFITDLSVSILFICFVSVNGANLNILVVCY